MSLRIVLLWNVRGQPSHIFPAKEDLHRMGGEFLFSLEEVMENWHGTGFFRQLHRSMLIPAELPMLTG